MSEEHVDTIKRTAAAFTTRDAEGAIACAHPEIVFTPLRAATEGSFKGHHGLREFADDTWETFDLFRLEYTDLRDLGGRVVAIGTITVRGKASGLETEIPTAAVYEFRDGLIWRYTDYGEVEAALSAAGVSLD